MTAQRPNSLFTTEPKSLDENLGETLLILKQTIKVAEGRTVHAGQAARCLELTELQGKISELRQKLKEASGILSDPLIIEWMAENASVPF